MDTSPQAQKHYDKMVKEASPNSKLASNCIKAFVVGGGISVVGQLLISVFTNLGASADDAASYTAITLIFSGVLLTGLGIYDKAGKFAGAGTIVPITGFANAVAAPAIEHKREGYILGVASKMFVVAGPVIVYGVLASIICGALYYVFR